MGRDSNPGYLVGTHAFQACTIDRSVTHPLKSPAPGLKGRGIVVPNLFHFKS